MPARPNGLLLATVLLAFPALLACGGKADTPATYPVTGIVTINEQLVAGAHVQFHPTNADYAAPAAGATAIGGQATTAADGSYQAETTFDRGKTSVPGLPAGAYKVTVQKMEAPAAASYNSRPKNTLDPRYASLESTPAKITVTPDGPNTYDITL